MEQFTIAINDRRKIFAIQQEFANHFPNLRIDFFGKPSTNGGQHSSKINSEAAHTLGDCRTEHNSGDLAVSDQMSIADLSSNFSDNYGLKIHVKQKLGHGWSDVADHGMDLEQCNQLAGLPVL